MCSATACLPAGRNPEKFHNCNNEVVMKITFFGTSAFAVASLKAVAASRHEVALVVTQPDAKKGRHLHLTPPPIKEVATGLELPVFQPTDVSSPESIKRLKALDADLFVVVAFGQLFRKEALAIPKKFAINLHASLLSKYRGAAPINWAIINGDKKTGVSVFRLVEKMDAGDIILDKAVDITEEDNAVTLSEKLSETGAKLLVEAIDLIEKNKASFKKQDESLRTLAPKLKKADGLLDWTMTATKLHNMARGLLPWPGAFTTFRGETIKLLETQVASSKEETGRPGEIIKIEPGLGILAKAGNGTLAIQRLQREGSRPMQSDEFLRGHPLRPGDILG
jgi:methionyl-tRNA formyltransferase